MVLRDLASRNGTFVDDVRLSGSRVLTGGERLRFGDEQLRVDAGSAISAPDGGEQPDRSTPAAEEASGRRIRLPRIGRRGLAVAAVAVAAVLLVGVAQLVLPGVAEQRLRSSLARYGSVQRVHIESTPAIKLLWHRADRVEVAMASYRSEPGGHASLADFLSRTRDTGSST